MDGATDLDVNFWLDQIDLTPGLEMRASLASHPAWGACLRVVSSCPAGAMETRVSPRGWVVGARANRPKLPSGWSAKRHRDMSRSPAPSSLTLGLGAARAQSHYALLAVYHHTGDERDLVRIVDPLRAFKAMGLADFDGFEKARENSPLAFAAPAAMAVKMVPLDRVEEWIIDLERAFEHFDGQGRPVEPRVFFDDEPLDSLRALAAASRQGGLRELGTIRVEAGRRLVVGDPQREGRQGVKVAMKPGAYGMFCATEGGELRMLAALSRSAPNELLLDDSRWRFAGRVFIASGMAGIVQEPKRPWPAKRQEEIERALEESFGAGAWAWGACSKVPEELGRSGEDGEEAFEGGEVLCEALLDGQGAIVGLRMTVGEFSSQCKAQLREMAGARLGRAPKAPAIVSRGARLLAASEDAVA